MPKFVAFLRNNFLAIVLAILPALGIWYFLQRVHAGLTVEVTSDIPILNIDSTFFDSLDVRYKGTRIATLRSVALKISNSGNRPILRVDFDAPITLRVPGQILGTPQIEHRSPPDLGVVVKEMGPNTITILPLLLNPGDYFSFRLLVADVGGSDTPIYRSGRVVGVKQINFVRATPGTDYGWPFSDFHSILGVLSTVFVAASLRVVTQAVSVEKLINSARRTRQITAGGLRNVQEQGEVRSLAARLGIAQHDYKSNLLVLRLKIENQLRDLARSRGLSDREQLASLPRLADSLHRRGVLPIATARLIRAVAVPMNRELHELDSYLSPEEFEALQTVALDIVVSLQRLSDPAA